jgi:hypothetical protein
MNNEIQTVIERLNVHAWGTSGMNSKVVLSDVLLQLELGHSVDLDEIRLIVLEDLQCLNDAIRKINPEERQPDQISLKLAYAISKIILLLFDTASSLSQKDSFQTLSVARDISRAWYCVLSCDIENVKDGF